MSKGSLWLLLVFIGVIACESSVFVGTTENFNKLIEDNEYVLVEFYAPWCGHCKNLEPQYEKAAQTLKEEGSSIILAKVDATIENKLAETYGVRGYPTLIFFRKGDQVPFDGERSAANIVAWVKKKSGPPSTLLKSKEEATTFSSKGSTVLGLFTDDKSPNFENFLKTAKEEEAFSFAHRFGVDKESVSLRTKDDNVKQFKEEKFSNKELKDWIQKEGYPVLNELDQEVWTRSANNKLPLLAVFVDPKNFEELKPALQQVATSFYGSVVTAWMDGVKNNQLVSRWGGSGSVIPTAFLVTFPANPKIVVWDEDTEKELNSETLNNFVKKALVGEYSTYLKSEPVPESNDGPVKVVVGKTFNQIVNDATKDVLVEFYAPWCGHCKKLEPIYEQLGKKFQGVDSVTIAKMDATANAAPENIEINGFPTIIFFPANDKKNFVSYEGNRELSSLVDFVVEKATHKIQFGKEDL